MEGSDCESLDDASLCQLISRDYLNEYGASAAAAVVFLVVDIGFVLILHLKE